MPYYQIQMSSTSAPARHKYTQVPINNPCSKRRDVQSRGRMQRRTFTRRGLRERNCDHHALSLDQKPISAVRLATSRAPAPVEVNSSSLLTSGGIECGYVSSFRELGDTYSDMLSLCCSSTTEVPGHNTLLNVFRPRFASSVTSSGAPRRSTAVV